MRTLRNWRHRYLGKTLIAGGVLTFAVLVLDAIGHFQTIRQGWQYRGWLISFITTVALPPWLQAVLMVMLGLLLLWAIYELQTRPPIVLHSETRYPIPQRTYDLALGIIDLDVTPQELMRIYKENTGVRAGELTKEYVGKYLRASGTFLNAHPDPRGYDVHLKLDNGGLVFVEMNEIDNHEHLSQLNKGDRITLRGRLLYANELTLKLSSGQFVESKHLVSENYMDMPKGPPISLPH